MKILLFIILLFPVLNAFSSPRPTIHLVHINGINTTPDEACQNLAELQNKISLNSNIVEWDLDYNPTNTGVSNLFKSIWDTLNQKAKEQQIISIDDYVNSYMLANNLDYPVDSPQYDALKSQMLPDYESAFINAAGNNYQTLLSNFMESFPPPAPNDYTNTSDFFLLIPHSQGNLYANVLFEALISSYHLPGFNIAIYSIASPANSTEGDWPATVMKNGGLNNITTYTTSENDYVINGLNVIYPTLPANINIPFSTAQPLGHNLIQTYLTNQGSLNQISYMIDGYACVLTIAISNFLNNNSYYKLAVLWAKKGGGLAGPTNSLLCGNGVCNNDFDYYIPERLDEEYGVYFLPPQKFISGTYTTFGDNTYSRQLEVHLPYKVDVNTVYTDAGDGTVTCGWFSYSSQSILYTYGMGEIWSELQADCPQYFMYNMFISTQAVLH